MLFSEFVDINPRVSIEKGTEYPCVMMDEVQPGEKFVSGIISKPFKSGAKFKKDDTLFARITPCLENGKIAKYTGHYRLCGFGSTEFFVFRAKDGISDSDYVYYLALSDIIRKPAEASMFGASGRQRADLSVIENIEIDPPSLPIQKKIAGILSAYDDLIENNSRRIKILEEMAQTIYQEWFVKFRFPGHEKARMVDSPLGKIPEGWEVKRLSTIVDTQYGYTESASEEVIGPKFLRGKDINKNSYINWDEVPYCKIDDSEYPRYKLNTGDIVIIRMADPGKVGIVEREVEAIFASYLIRLTIKNGLDPYYLFHFLLSNRYQSYITGASTGTTRKSASAGVITDIDLMIPDKEALKKFSALITPLRQLLNKLLQKNENLKRTHDLLLPKLISGEIDVEDLDVDVGELAE